MTGGHGGPIQGASDHVRAGALMAGAAQSVITPPLGVTLSGWGQRAAGHNRATYVHDDLYVKCLVVRNEERAWGLISADVPGVAPVVVERIRLGVESRIPLAPESVLVCGTHCHSSPIMCPHALACAPGEFSARSVQSDGAIPRRFGRITRASSAAIRVGESNEEWKQSFVDKAVQTCVSAWEHMRPAEAAFGEAKVDGVASSRRVLLADGTWGDPRSRVPDESEVVARTEIDPMVRTMLLRHAGTRTPLAAVVNYGCHPWVFSIDGISAELPGATCEKVSRAWGAGAEEAPVILHLTGPEGDASLIWNIDVDRVWRTRPGETVEQSLERRKKGFAAELDRLSARLADGVMCAIGSVSAWDATADVGSRRKEVLLPLKEGFEMPPEILQADWQRHAPPSSYITEVQFLRIGAGGILGLPDEPFTSIGRAIREEAGPGPLLIAALANDYGALGYVPDAEAWDLGGYEVEMFPSARATGQVLADQAVQILCPQADRAT